MTELERLSKELLFKFTENPDKIKQYDVEKVSPFIRGRWLELAKHILIREKEKIVEELKKLTPMFSRIEIIVRSADKPAITEGFLSRDLDKALERIAKLKTEIAQLKEGKDG